jgi:hypothetical protein
VLSVEVTDDLIVKSIGHSHNPTDALLNGCFILGQETPGTKPAKFTTVAGMLTLDLQGEIYFNLHTTAQTFYGDLRGQLSPPGERFALNDPASTCGAPDRAKRPRPRFRVSLETW